MRGSIITRLLHSRNFGLIAGVLSLIGAAFFYFGGFTMHIEGDKGLALPSANCWIASESADFFAGMAGSILTLLIMWLLNKVYNVLRTVTGLYIAFFALMQLATPDLLTQFYTGTLLAIIVPASMLLLFSRFRSPTASKRIFLIFLMLSLSAATQYCYALYIPVFLLGCAQMRVFNRRTITAAILGLITPWWIMFGFGIIDPTQVHAPELINIFTTIRGDESILLLVTVAFTALLLLVCHILNVFKTIAYNSQARSINGVFTVTGIATVVAMCVDYRNIISYIPLLNFCAAMEGAHYFATHRADKSFIAIIAVAAVYTAIFLCQTAI